MKRKKLLKKSMVWKKKEWKMKLDTKQDNKNHVFMLIKLTILSILKTLKKWTLTKF